MDMKNKRSTNGRNIITTNRERQKCTKTRTTKQQKKYNLRYKYIQTIGVSRCLQKANEDQNFILMCELGKLK